MVLVCTGLLAACGDSCGKDKGGPGTNPPNGDFVITDTATEITVPYDGCLNAPVSVETGEGARLDLNNGTCLTTRYGETLTGPVRISLRTGEPFREQIETASGETLSGLIEVVVELVDPSGGGADVRVDAAFEPNATLHLDELLADRSGYWHAPMYGTLIVDEQVGSIAARPPGDPVPPSLVLKHDARIPAETNVFTVPISSVIAIHVDDDILPAPDTEFVGDCIYEEVLGAVGETYPGVGSLAIGNGLTGQEVAGGSWYPPLSQPGDRRIIDAFGATAAYEVKIIERDGQRVLQVKSRFKNVHRIEVGLRTGPDFGNFETKVVDGTGSDGEAEADGPYIGSIEVIVSDCGKFSHFYRDIVPIIRTAAGDPGGPIDGYARIGSRRQYVGVMRVLYEKSTQELAKDLPPTWTVTASDRLLLIDIPWPAPTVVASNESAMTVSTLLPLNNYALDVTSQVLSAPPQEAALNFDDLIYVSVGGAIEIVDALNGQIVGNVPVPGLTSALALDTFGSRIYAATDAGEFLAINLDTLNVDFMIALPPLDAGLNEEYTSITLRPSGSHAWVASPATDEVIEVDLLRGAESRVFTLPNVYSSAVSNDGLALAVVDFVLGGVHMVDLLAPGSPMFVATGIEANVALWPSVDDGVLVASYNQSNLTFVDRSDLSTITVNVGSGPSAIAEEDPGTIPTRILVVNYLDNTLSRFDYVDIGTTPGQVPTGGLNPTPNLVRTSGQ